MENDCAAYGFLPLQVCLQHASPSLFLTYTPLVFLFFFWLNGKGELLDPISESLIRTNVAEKRIFFCMNAALIKT